MTDTTSTTLGDLTENVAGWYRQRFSSFFRRTLNQGLGAFLFMALFLTAALIAGRIAWLGGRKDQEYVARLMQTKVQPQQDASRATVMALLLAGVQDSEVHNALYCEASRNGACKFGEDLWVRTQQLLDFTAPGSRPITWCSSSLSETLQTQPQLSTRFPYELAHDSNLTSIISNSYERCRMHYALPMARSESEISTADASSCGSQTEHAKRAAAFNLATPRCRGSGASLTFEIVPQQAADGLQADAGMGFWPTRPRDYRVQRARMDGDLFEIALASLLATDAKLLEADSESPELVAAYLISVDSVLRYWPKNRDVAPHELPPYRLWASRPYVEAMISSQDLYGTQTTLPYVDYAGHGIVKTTCRPLTAISAFPASTAETAAGDQRAVVATLCVDYALPDKRYQDLIKAVDNGPLTDAIEIELRTTRNGESDVHFVSHDLPRWVTAGVAAKVRERVAVLQPTSVIRRDILPLMEGVSSEYSSFFVIPGRSGADGVRRAVLLRVTGVGPLGSRPIPMLLAVLCSVLAAAAWRIGSGSSKEVADRERLLSRLRSLQAAVVQTDGHDHITAANDRAEELIGVQLPEFGIGRRRRVPFCTIVDTDSLLLEPAMIPQPLLADPPLDQLQNCDQDKIREHREQGRTSSYYVRLRIPRPGPPSNSQTSVEMAALSSRWLRVTAGPILLPAEHPARGASTSSPSSRNWWQPAHEDLLGTFGVIEPVMEATGKALDAELERRRRDSSPTANGGGAK